MAAASSGLKGIRVSPLGLFHSLPIFARSLLGAMPTEHVREQVLSMSFLSSSPRRFAAARSTDELLNEFFLSEKR